MVQRSEQRILKDESSEKSSRLRTPLKTMTSISHRPQEGITWNTNQTTLTAAEKI